MPKKFIIINSILFLFCIALSGCQQITNSIVTIKELNTHPNQYLGKTVTVTGTIYFADLKESSFTLFDNEMNSLFAITSNATTKPIPLVDHATYSFTGIVRYGDVSVFGIPYHLGDRVYIETIKIE